MKATITKKTPIKCPICGGRGFVPIGFYTYPTTNFVDPQCKQCNGTGILYEETVEIKEDEINKNKSKY